MTYQYEKKFQTELNAPTDCVFYRKCDVGQEQRFMRKDNQRQLLCYVNLIRACQKILNQLVYINVCKKHEKSNIRPVLSLQDSSGTCPEVPPGPEGQARPDLCPTFEYSGYLVFPRDLNYFCIANLNCIANTKVVYLKYSKH